MTKDWPVNRRELDSFLANSQEKQAFLPNFLQQSVNFDKVPSALQRFQPVDSMQDLLGPHANQGRIDYSQSRSVLRACKFAWHPEKFVPELAQRKALPFRGKTGPLKSCD